jgi:hypothetical protein
VNKKLFVCIVVIAAVGFLPVTSIGLRREKQNVAIEKVKEQYESALMTIEGILGVGIGNCEGKACIKVYAERESITLKKKIPKQLGGFKVELEVLGPIQALPK